MKLILFSFLLTVTLINMSISVKQPKHHLKNEKVNKTKVRAKQVMIIPADEDNYPEHWDLHNSRFRRSAIRASSEHVPQGNLNITTASFCFLTNQCHYHHFI
jgi:hypothetical protein